MTLIEIGPDVVSCTPPVVTLPCSATVWLADRVAAIWAPVPVQVSGAPEKVPGEQLAQGFRRGMVERSRRLVRQNYFRIINQSAANRYALLLSAG